MQDFFFFLCGTFFLSSLVAVGSRVRRTTPALIFVVMLLWCSGEHDGRWFFLPRAIFVVFPLRKRLPPRVRAYKHDAYAPPPQILASRPLDITQRGEMCFSPFLLIEPWTALYFIISPHVFSVRRRKETKMQEACHHLYPIPFAAKNP